VTDESPPDRFRTIVYSITAAATLSFGAWLGTSVNGMADRLTTIEVTIRENKAEREAQVNDLRARLGRLEEERNNRMLRDDAKGAQ